MTKNHLETIHSVQLESTSRCDLACVTCLKTEYADQWQERDMDQDLFAHVLSQLKELKPSIHLQGWGEPLSHRKTLHYVNKLKSHGFTVSFTTNGTLMSRSIAGSLVESKIDGLTFSMAGISPPVQDPLRGAGTSDAVRRAICTVAEVKKSLGSSAPALAVSYLLTPETVRELPAAVSWCRKNDVEAFVTVHLTQAGGRRQKELQYLNWEQDSWSDRFLRMKTHARSLFAKMLLELKPFHAVLTPVCDKDPLNSLFINANGDVSPCVFLCPPLGQGINCRYRGGSHYLEPLIFGNVRAANLDEIWGSQAYRDFRMKFRERIDYHDSRLARVSYSFSGSRELENAVKDIQAYFSVHCPPEPCRGCAKLDGF